MADTAVKTRAGGRRAARRAFALAIVAVGCLTPVAVGQLDRPSSPAPGPRADKGAPGARQAETARAGTGHSDARVAESWPAAPPAPPQPPAFVFDPAESRHAALAPGSVEPPKPNVPEPVDATAAIERAAPDAAIQRRVSLDPPAYSAYAPAVDPAYPTGLVDPAAGLGIDITGLREGIDAYRREDIAKGDAALAQARDPLVATTLEWVLLRTHPVEAGYRRIARFLESHPDWPARDWLRRHAEQALYASNPPAASVLQFYAAEPPRSAIGRVTLARALLADDQTAKANELARRIWREDDLNVSLESVILKNFGASLTAADSKRRADRLLYRDQVSPALRAARLAGPDETALVSIRAAALRHVATDKTFADAPPAVRNDPGLVFAKIQYLMRAKKYAEAGAAMQSAPRDPAAIIDGDAWWDLRRDLARKLLDAGDAAAAYRICAGSAPESSEDRLAAEFHAGWIALRFLNDPARAIPHFDRELALAATPISRSRAAYWRGRAAEAAGQDAAPFYAQAAQEPTTFYGQLARLRLGRDDLPIRLAPYPAQGDARAESIRAIELLYAAGAKDLAVPLVYFAARAITSPEQMAALGAVVVMDRDPKVSLILGKLASQHGQPIDDLAFPTYGVPQFAPYVNSASLPIVMSVARQESAFDPKARSSAGAMGLMQMIASTARRTAQRVGVGFDPARMTRDPVFNAQLGAAHLGDLMKEQRNSLILTFAAYNAGGHRVKQWIAAYGDPRRPGVDPIDWIERIPFDETRNYLQRVLENLTVYRARLGVEAKAADALKREARM